MNKSLKHRKPIVYISLIIYSLLMTFIIFESCLPGGYSTIQSDFFAMISAWFINETTGPVINNVIKPTSISKVTDSSYLGKDEEGNAKIAIGTTTKLAIEATYPIKENKNDVYDNSYEIKYVSGNKDDYNVVLSSSISNNTYTTVLRIVANNLTNDLYEIDVVIAKELTYPYKFHIVELEAPTTYECRVNKTNIKKGESLKVETKLFDDRNNDDHYLRRCLDESKLSRSSLDESIATIDEYGYIHGVNEGSTTIKYGKYDFEINVSNESIIKPLVNSINIHKDDNGNINPYLLDYDYVFKANYESDDYSVLLYPTFTDDTLEDQSFIYTIDDPLKAKITPYKYDEDGYPQYFDEDNKPCFRVSGYRKKGNVNVRVLSATDTSIYKDILLDVQEAYPLTMDVNGLVNKLEVNAQMTITPKITPDNSFNNALHVVSDNNDAIEIKNNDSTSITITALKEGVVNLTITALGNDTLVKTYQLEIVSKSTINDDNYSDFHTFVRKGLGHFLLFLFTAIFGYIFFYTFIDDIKKLWLSILLSISCGVLVAGISELIQYFIPSRGGVWADVGIDSLGYIVGTFITFGVILLIRYIRNKKKTGV